MSTLFAFPSKNQLNAQGAVTENPGRDKSPWGGGVRGETETMIAEYL